MPWPRSRVSLHCSSIAFYWQTVLHCFRGIIYLSFNQLFVVVVDRVNGKLVALKVIRLQEEEGTPFTAIREGTCPERKAHTNICLFIFSSSSVLSLLSISAERPEACQHRAPPWHHPHQGNPDAGLRVCGESTLCLTRARMRAAVTAKVNAATV